MFDYWKGMIMNLTDFYEVYPNEEACEHALKEFRECHTLYCPECGGVAPQLESKP
ncbi:hypothetical protein PRBRB14_17520 [Hallella multisaccharivorax DSM 17128]|nr:hypothetical protein PRBRB14_17520 [Hallella multisaccharivorax DSM 17128]